MSSSIVSALNFASSEVTIYLGTPLLLTGVIGGIFNIIVFLSLQTFRQNSCAFYMVVMSCANIGQLMMGLLSRLVITGFNVDWTVQSVFYCKFRIFMLYICSLISLSSMCLVTIDQYMATSSRPQWQQWSNIKIARRLLTVVVTIWILHAIPTLIYFDHVVSPITGVITCTSTSAIYQEYYTYGYVLSLLGVVPAFITVVFGCLAYQNVRQLSHRILPLIRRQLDKQLTTMVLLQVIFNFFALVPPLITTILLLQNNLIKDPVILAQIQLANYTSFIPYYFYFASPFYIYICVSQRFRQQFFYVIFGIHLKRFRRPRIIINQVLPET
ncbi:unnamed protein product [Adineta steineri]|uniref:G-protein coupled receptors family 1 profile domain-containing protein n=1 Tax=Adineta steineri TaxID=433720 RepID=A0A815MBP8_9BILA|nr:unnamed protein product [Adineta steineri]CAF1421977.1 unnamed protein product [Adineta steineri]